MRRFTLVAVFAAALLTLGSTAALAAGTTVQANGSGQTHDSATFGFNADSNLTGSLHYVSDDGTYNIHCSQIDTFTGTVNGSTGKAVFTATCVDQDGTTVYAWVQAKDLGEPGTNDWFCIGFSYDPITPGVDFFIHDMGIIENGNIQIHNTH